VNDEAYQLEVDALIRSRIAQLRTLTFAQAAALPETVGEERIILNRKCTLTVFVQLSPYLLSEQTLATVQGARLGVLGVSYHVEGGLVFSPDGSIRDATEEELQNSGG
jgi:hypothetical protein